MDFCLETHDIIDFLQGAQCKGTNFTLLEQGSRVHNKFVIKRERVPEFATDLHV